MDIQELETYDLSRAVQFHDRLNPRIWDEREEMRPEVRERLLAIAQDFQEFLGVADLDIQDITISGSNAAYSYTPHSDVDLHLVVRMPEDPVYQELFNAKKYQYNDEHDIRIGGADVELYVQDAAQPHVSQGIYSVRDGKWIRVPRRKAADINDDSVRHKYEDLGQRIERVIDSGDEAEISAMIDRVKDLRKTGLAKNGEFGAENLAFKLLRQGGLIQGLYDARMAAQDQRLSLAERRKKRGRRSRARNTVFPWFSYYGTGAVDSGEGGDGGGGESLRESAEDQDRIVKFVDFVSQRLGLESVPTIHLHSDPEWSEQHHTFGMYDVDTGELHVSTAGRHVMDVMRTIAHELTHRSQDQDHGLAHDAGETGSAEEDEANAEAGRVMRQWAETNPEIFSDVAVSESSGYIPTAAQKDDPRFSMALTQDIRPGETGRQANKLKLKTDNQGRPDLLMKKLGNLLESVKRGDIIDEDEDLQEVAMNPGAYRRFLDSKDSEGIQAGFEAELVFRGAQQPGDDDEGEDWDADTRVWDIDDVIEFFSGGDNGLTSSQQSRLRERMWEDYLDWINDSFYSEVWEPQRYQAWLRENKWDDEKSEYLDRAAKELSLDRDDDRVEARALEMFEEQAEQQWEDQGEWYEEAQEALMDDHRDSNSESEWLGSEGLRYASDVGSSYNLDWPYLHSVGVGRNGPGRTWDDIGDSLSQATGMPVTVGSSYHSTKRRPGEYVLEPDSSIRPDEDDEVGLEVVSPPLPLPQALEQLRRVVDWANDPNRGNAYSKQGDERGGGGTGLHMGVSLPVKGGDVDPIKLILFMGDQEILERFERQSNTYTESAWKRLQSRIKRMRDAGPKQIAEIMDAMRSSLWELATQNLQAGVLGNKYVSVNPHGSGDKSYIEFRGPGGDYLATEDRNYQVLENTMLQLAYAMHIAGSPDLYRKEYAKKLYKSLLGFRGAETQRPESVYVVSHRPSGEKIMVSARTTAGATRAASRVRPEWTNPGDLESTLADRQQVRDFPARLRYTTTVETDTDNAFARLFADYSAGTLSRDELKSQWADIVLNAEKAAADDSDGVGEFSGEYEVYDQDSGTRGDRDSRTVIDTFPANSDQEAVDLAREKWDGHGIRYGVRRKIQEPEKPVSQRADLAQRLTRSTQDVGEQLWRVNHHSSIQWVTARSQAEAVEQAVQKDRMFNSPDTRARIATDQEKELYQLEQQRRRERDAARDAEQVRASSGEPRPIPNEAPRSTTSPDATHALYHTSRVHRDSRGNPDPQVPEIYFTAADDTEVASMVERYNRHHGPGYVARPVAGNRPFWRVSWKERQGDDIVRDSTRIMAGSEKAAIELLRWALRNSGRRGHDFRAERIVAAAPAPAAAPAAVNTDIGQPRVNTTRDPAANWAIVRRSNGEIVIPFTRDTQPEALEYFRDWVNSRIGPRSNYQLVPLLSRQAAAQLAQDIEQMVGPDDQDQDQSPRVTASTPGAGEWTGRWLVRSTLTGETVHTISGIGNAQADANRHAARWVQSTGFDDSVEVVPEMR